MHEGKPHTWQDEDTYWRSNFRSRPYASSSDNYDRWRGGYQYGYDSAGRYSGKNWSDVEPELSRNWNSYEHRGTSTWDQVKDAVRDAWDRVTGHHPVGSR